MYTLPGIAEQIVRCFTLAYQSGEIGIIPELLDHLLKTIEALVISKLVRRSTLAREGGMVLLMYTDGPPPPGSDWRLWFRTTQRHICQQFFNETIETSDYALDHMIDNLQDMHANAERRLSTRSR